MGWPTPRRLIGLGGLAGPRGVAGGAKRGELHQRHQRMRRPAMVLFCSVPRVLTIIITMIPPKGCLYKVKSLETRSCPPTNSNYHHHMSSSSSSSRSIAYGFIGWGTPLSSFRQPLVGLDWLWEFEPPGSCGQMGTAPGTQPPRYGS